MPKLVYSINYRKGFTLTELLVVMIIIAILVAIAVPLFVGYSKNANLTALRSDLDLLRKVKNIYEYDKNSLPPTKGSPITISRDTNPTLYDEITKMGLPPDGWYELDLTKIKTQDNMIKRTHYGSCKTPDDRFIIHENGGAICYERGVEGKYGKIYHCVEDKNDISKAEEREKYIQEKIKEGYIPVANAYDLYAVRGIDYNTGEHTPRKFAIGTSYETDYISDYGLSSKYIQVADIDLATSPFNQNWDKISSGWDSKTSDWGYGFIGIYNGGNYKISNLYQKVSYGAGLFDGVKGGIFRNIVLENVNIHDTGGSTGALIGSQQNDSNDILIENCYVTGKIKGGTYLGGIIGYLYKGKINNCYFNGEITNDDNTSLFDTGGIVGYTAKTCTISNCHVNANFISTKGMNYLGGVVGYLSGGDSYIVNCSYVGSIVNNSSDSCYNIGGIVGYVNQSDIYNCSSNVEIDAERIYYAGGIVGTNSMNNSNKVENCVSKMEMSCNYIYTIGGIAGYHYYAPIKSSSASLTINNINDFYSIGGLVGDIYSGSIEECLGKLDAPIIPRTGIYAGGLIGKSYKSIIKNCNAKANISQVSYYAGGLIGQDVGSTVAQCYSISNIQGIYGVGGLMGYSNSSKIIQCYFQGTVDGRVSRSGYSNYYAGGLIGEGYKVVEISDSFSQGEVYGITGVGGLIGGLIWNTQSKITNCYSNTLLQGTDRVGGILGEIRIYDSSTRTVIYDRYDTVIVSNTYWNKDKYPNSPVGEGKTTAEFISGIPFPNWDTNIWEFKAGKFPELKNVQ